jgi:hypothetical protein
MTKFIKINLIFIALLIVYAWISIPAQGGESIPQLGKAPQSKS